MKHLNNQRNIRVALLVTILFAGIAFVGIQGTDCVKAQTCQESFSDYQQADFTYGVAFNSLFYNSPTSCATACTGLTGGPLVTCLADCQTTRQTALAEADLALFGAAGATCTPFTIDECASARSMADLCVLQYPFASYSDPDESIAVFAQYSACRTASKVDSCQ